MNVKQWMKQTTEAERVQVADKAGTSVGYLWQLAGGYRRASPEKAQSLEDASREVTPDRVMSRFSLVFGDSSAA